LLGRPVLSTEVGFQFWLAPDLLTLSRGEIDLDDAPAFEAVLGAARKVASGFDWRLNPLLSPAVEAVYSLSYVPIAIFGVWGMIMTRALPRTRYN
jgi:hypothetical protein